MRRVTITLPEDLVCEMDRAGKNRSRFVLEAVRNEIERRRREALRGSLESPHPEALEMAGAGFDAWAIGLPEEDAAGLVDIGAGKTVRWVPERGWMEESDA